MYNEMPDYMGQESGPIEQFLKLEGELASPINPVHALAALTVIENSTNGVLGTVEPHHVSSAFLHCANLRLRAIDTILTANGDKRIKPPFNEEQLGSLTSKRQKVLEELEAANPREKSGPTSLDAVETGAAKAPQDDQ